MSRKHKTHRVTRGQLSGEGKTKAEARADLEKQIDYALGHVKGMFVESRFGCILIANPTLTGFETKTIFPDMVAQHGLHHWSGCHMSGDYDLKDVVMGLRLNVAQWAWKPDCDEVSLITNSGLDDRRARELESWIAFQRSYIVYKANGASDAEAHRLACTR